MFGQLGLSDAPGRCSARGHARTQLCAACHGLRRSGGPHLSLLANDDLVFFLAVASALAHGRDGEAEALAERPCTAAPWRSVELRRHSPAVLELASALDIALVHAKLEDDVQDEGRWWTRLGRRLLDGDGREALHRLSALGHPTGSLRELGTRQQAAERDPGASFASLAAPTAGVLGDAFASLARVTGSEDRRADLEALGRSLGRFLYLWDAVVDERRDRKAGSFNAIDRVLGPDGSRATLRNELEGELRSLRDALAALPTGDTTPYFEAVVDSLASRVEDRLGGARMPRWSTSHPPRHLTRQAGALDCCDVLECCAGGSGCSDCKECGECLDCCCGGSSDGGCCTRRGRRRRRQRCGRRWQRWKRRWC